MSKTLEAIQKAPWEREAELDQLRSLCRDQNEALVGYVKLMDDLMIVHVADIKARAVIVKYNEIIKWAVKAK